MSNFPKIKRLKQVDGGVAEALKFYDDPQRPPIPAKPTGYLMRPGSNQLQQSEAVRDEMKRQELHRSAMESPANMPPSYEKKYSRGSTLSKRDEDFFPKLQPTGAKPLQEAAYTQLGGDPYSSSSKLLMEQMKILDEQVRAIAKRQNYLAEEERGFRGRIDSSFKVVNDQTSLLINDLSHRVSMLDDSLSREQERSIQLMDKLKESEHINSETQRFLKALQKQTETEMSQMRNLLSEKLGEDQMAQVKNKEKNLALFNEVVRIGQEVEKQGQEVRQLAITSESKFQIHESRLIKTEQEAVNAGNIGASISSSLSSQTEKTEARLGQLEVFLQSVVNDQKLGKDALKRIEAAQVKNSEDIKEALFEIQKEVNSKIEMRANDTLSRLRQETDDRQRALDDLRFQLSLKERSQLEQAKLDFDTLKERLADFEEKIKEEGERRGELLSKIEANFDGQVKTMQNQLRKEEINRAQQELMLKSDITKLAEQLRTDYELFKSQQNQLTEKITEMIKLEVDTRLSSEKENKVTTETMLKRIIDEMNSFKEAVEKQNQRFAKDLKEANSENSERANFLSHYIDDQIKKQEENVDTQIQKIKLLCAKLTEQIKEHLQNNEITITEMKAEHQRTSDELTEKIETLSTNTIASFSDISTNHITKYIKDEVEFSNIYTLISQLQSNFTDRVSYIESQFTSISANIEIQETNCLARVKDALETAKQDSEKKVQFALERIKKESSYRWVESIKLTEQIISGKDVSARLELAPAKVLSMEEAEDILRSKQNELDPSPKPVLKTIPSAVKKEIKDDILNSDKPIPQEEEIPQSPEVDNDVEPEKLLSPEDFD